MCTFKLHIDIICTEILLYKEGASNYEEKISLEQLDTQHIQYQYIVKKKVGAAL